MTTTETTRQYYYRPLALFSGRVYKCAGFGAEQPEHRAFYEPYFASNMDRSKTFLGGCLIFAGYQGDRITWGGQAWVEYR